MDISNLKKKNKKRITSKHIFCYAFIVIFVGHWAFFFFSSNINSLLLSFQYFDLKTETFKFYSFSNIFTNYADFFKEVFADPNVQGYLWNGFKVGIITILWTFVPFIVSFVLYKKMPLTKTFMIIFYLPGVLTGIFIAMSFKYFIEWGFPELMMETFGLKEFPRLISNKNTAFGTLLFYQLYFSFASGMMVYVGTMKKIPESLVEYGQLEGLSFIQEFFYLALPSLYNIVVMSNLGILTVFFMASLPAFDFYGSDGYQYNVATFQYYLYTSIVGGTRGRAELSYGFTTAANYIIGLISILSVVIMKPIFDKFDPEFEV